MSFNFKDFFYRDSDYWKETRPGDYIKRAKEWLAKTNEKKAIEQLENGLKKHSGNPELLVMLANIYYMLKEYNDATEQLQKIGNEYKLTREIELYKHYLNLNQFENANNQLDNDNNFTETDPKHIQNLLKLNENYKNEGDIKRKMVCIKTAMRIYLAQKIPNFKPEGEKICNAFINLGNLCLTIKDDEKDIESVKTECFKYARLLLGNNTSNIFLLICDYHLSLAELFEKKCKPGKAKQHLDIARKICMLQPSSTKRNNKLHDIAKKFNDLANNKFKPEKNHTEIVACIKLITISYYTVNPDFKNNSAFKTIKENLSTWAKKVDATSKDKNSDKSCEQEAKDFCDQIKNGTFEEKLRIKPLNQIKIAEDKNDNDTPIAPPPPGFKEFKIKKEDGCFVNKRFSVQNPFGGNILDGRKDSSVSMERLIKEMQQSKKLTPIARRFKLKQHKRKSMKPPAVPLKNESDKNVLDKKKSSPAISNKKTQKQKKKPKSKIDQSKQDGYKKPSDKPKPVKNPPAIPNRQSRKPIDNSNSSSENTSSMKPTLGGDM